MPTVREALLDAAYEAVLERPWATVRMVDVAAAARVSRQTLYNEFGSKDGLARALLRREAQACVDGIDEIAVRAARAGAEAEGFVLLADWLVARAAARPLLRALLTGCQDPRLPAPRH
ncbi:TetR/AcrR family transcriptional regulator, partial [Streptomyces sp. TRM64462]|uniref:TetR/AcrR family transcriptional regulator n=1 Tax=Streptomyces sp. TRM64462 TaxID=2741726 RepID=UPI001586ABB9